MLSLKKEVYELYKPVLLKHKSLFLLLGLTGLISGASSVIMPVLLKMETDQLVSKKGEIFGITLFYAFEVFIIILGMILVISIIERILNSITQIFTKAKNDLLKNELQLSMFRKMENMEMGRIGILVINISHLLWMMNFAL